MIINIDKNVPRSLVLDAPKVQSIILHLLFDLNNFMNHEEGLNINFSLDSKTLIITLSAMVYQKDSMLNLLFKKKKRVELSKENRLSLKISTELTNRIKGIITNTHIDNKYKFIVNIPIKMINL